MALNIRISKGTEHTSSLAIGKRQSLEMGHGGKLRSRRFKPKNSKLSSAFLLHPQVRKQGARRKNDEQTDIMVVRSSNACCLQALRWAARRSTSHHKAPKTLQIEKVETPGAFLLHPRKCESRTPN
jgi:hypothetical protein